MMQSQMDNKELFLGRQASDEDVQAKFNELMNAIKTWSTRFAATGQAVYGNFVEGDLLKYQRVLPTCQSILDVQKLLNNSPHGKKKRIFTRGWAGYVMSELLFRTLKTADHEGTKAYDVWMDRRASRSVHRIENQLYDPGQFKRFENLCTM
jgi:hypothetical protein